MKRVLQLRCSGALLGAENVVLELSSNISKKYGYLSIVGVIHDKRDPYPEIAKQAEIRNIPFHLFEASKIIDINCIMAIRHFIKEQKIDIVHAHGYREDVYAFLSFSGITKIATNHLWKRSNKKLKIYAFIDSLSMVFFKHIVAVSQPILNEMRAIPYLRNRNLSLISNGIDIVKYSPTNIATIRQELKLTNDVTLMAAVSSLTTEKGHIYLLAALHRLKTINSKFHLVIIGEGPKRCNIESQIKELELTDHVTMLGKRHDIDKIHTGIDIYILPSLKEGLPMSLLEAMACGVASIASDVGDVSSCVKHNQTGMLIEAGNIDALYNAIEALTSDSEKRKTIGFSASRMIRSKFSNEQMIRSYADLYHTVS